MWVNEKQRNIEKKMKKNEKMKKKKKIKINKKIHLDLILFRPNAQTSYFGKKN